MKTFPPLEAVLPPIIPLSHRAGEAVMEFYSQPEIVPVYKDPGSPLTQADMASHHLITSQLNSFMPNVPILSEESENAPYAVRRLWKRFWLVDPLDGTKEFIQRNGEFTVNIALIDDGRPVLGVVHAPALNVTYFAAHGVGAFKQNGNNRIRPITVEKWRRPPLKVAASRSHADAATNEFLAKIGPADCIRMGSSLKFCLVAEGAAHLYPRLGPTMEWDTAAAQCVVEVAGGVVSDFHGRALRYNKPDLHNPHFVASGDPSFHWQTYLESKSELSGER